MVALDVFMGIPVAAGEAVVVAAEDLHKPHAPLEQPPGGEALEAEVVNLLLGIDLAGPAAAGSLHDIHPQYMIGIVGNAQGFRSGRLHAGGELVAFDAALQPRV